MKRTHIPDMMNQTPPVSTTELPRCGAGYLYFVGILQIGAGLLSVLFSLLAFLQVGLAESGGLLDPQQVAHRFAGHGSEGWASLVAGYVSFHVTYGWILGLLLISAGVCCIKLRARRLVWFSSLLNLLNFPHGTTAALMTWHGLSRDRISGAFSGEKS